MKSFYYFFCFLCSSLVTSSLVFLHHGDEVRFFKSPTAFNSATSAKDFDHADLAPGGERSFILPKLDIFFNSRVKPDSEFCLSLELPRSRPTLEALSFTLSLDNKELPLSLSNRHLERYHELLHQMPRFCAEKGIVISDLVKAEQVKIKVVNNSKSINSVVRLPVVIYKKELKNSSTTKTEPSLKFRLITINNLSIQAAMPFLGVFVFVNILLTFICYTIFTSLKARHF